MDDDTGHWPITEEDRRQAISALIVIIRSDDWTLSLRAVRLMLQMEDQNVRHDEATDRKIRAELSELMQ